MVTGALDELDKFVARPIHSGGELRSAWAVIQRALSRESNSRIPHDKRDRVGPFSPSRWDLSCPESS